MRRMFGGWISVAILASVGLPATGSFGQTSSAPVAMDTVKHLTDFSVVELRRYSVKEGEREHFARYFEAYFPEAMQQLGAIVAGEFLLRDQPVFTWIREFHNMDDRAKANAQLYYGPVWKEHKALMNSIITDSDNVLLLRPLSPERAVSILPSVDPVKEDKGAQGVVVAQIFPIQPNRVEEFARQMEPVFARYRALGAREAGVLVTLDATNNFPQLPIRTDGPYLVWLGIFKDSEAVNQFGPAAESALKEATVQGMLRGKTESLILDPAPRSRLRWLAESPGASSH